MEWLDDMIKELAHDGKHDMVLSMCKTSFVEINEYGELSPFASDIDTTHNLVIISNSNKMTEELFNVLIANAVGNKDGESIVYFTKLGYSQQIVDVADVHGLCDILELINNRES